MWSCKINQSDGIFDVGGTKFRYAVVSLVIAARKFKCCFFLVVYRLDYDEPCETR